MTKRVDELEWKIKEVKAELDYVKAKRAYYAANIVAIYALRRWRVIRFIARLRA